MLNPHKDIGDACASRAWQHTQRGSNCPIASAYPLRISVLNRDKPYDLCTLPCFTHNKDSGQCKEQIFSKIHQLKSISAMPFSFSSVRDRRQFVGDDRHWTVPHVNACVANTNKKKAANSALLLLCICICIVEPAKKCLKTHHTSFAHCVDGMA